LRERGIDREKNDGPEAIQTLSMKEERVWQHAAPARLAI
jgi:hypothetical protein